MSRNCQSSASFLDRLHSWTCYISTGDNSWIDEDHNLNLKALNSSYHYSKRLTYCLCFYYRWVAAMESIVLFDVQTCNQEVGGHHSKTKVGFETRHVLRTTTTNLNHCNSNKIYEPEKEDDARGSALLRSCHQLVNKERRWLRQVALKNGCLYISRTNVRLPRDSQLLAAHAEWVFDKDKAARCQVNLLSSLRAGVFVAGRLKCFLSNHPNS